MLPSERCTVDGAILIDTIRVLQSCLRKKVADQGPMWMPLGSKDFGRFYGISSTLERDGDRIFPKGISSTDPIYLTEGCTGSLPPESKGKLVEEFRTWILAELKASKVRRP